MTAILVLDNDFIFLDDVPANGDTVEFCVYIKDEENLIVNTDERCVNICNRRSIEL